MKKSEMEDHEAAYQDLMKQARAAEREGLYRKAVELALASWEHIDGMLQYGRRYERKEFATIQGIEMILKYAPLLMDYRSLDSLEELLKKCRRIEKAASEDLQEKIAASRAQLWDAHKLWDHLEKNPEFRQDQLRQTLGGDQDRWRSIVESWDNLGLICRVQEGGSYRLALAVRMSQIVSAKCYACGVIAEGPKAVFLDPLKCPECRTEVNFVILLNRSDGSPRSPE